MGRLCGGAHKISGMKAPLFLHGGVGVVTWVWWGGWVIGWWVGGKVGCGFDGGCRGGWCASEGWGGWCEVIVGDGVLGGGLLSEL